MNEKMTFFASYWDAIMKIKDPTDRLKAFEAVCGYGITGEEPEDLDGVAEIVFIMARPNIENSAKARNSGAKGGRASDDKGACENGVSTLTENVQAPLQKSCKHPSEKKVSNKDKDKEKEKEEEKGVGEGVVKHARTQTAVVDESDLSEPVKEKLKEWLAYKAERRDTYKETGLKALITEVGNREQEAGSSAVIAVINESMSQGWKGIIWDRMKKARSGTTVFDEWANA